MRVVQLTPPGSACSIAIGIGITDAIPGSVRGTHLVVSDIEAARDGLVERGVEVGEIRHLEDGRWLPGCCRSAGASRGRDRAELRLRRCEDAGRAGTYWPASPVTGQFRSKVVS